MGGLGNQLFQLFALLSYAKKYDKTPTIQYSEVLNCGIQRPTYWNSFLCNLKKYTTDKPINIPLMRERGFHYSELPFNKNPVKLYGYFQCHKYFKENYNYIINEIGLDGFKDEILNTYKPCFNNNIINVSMHFRLGDYKKSPLHHPIMPVTYYINSIKHIISTINNDSFNILYFCEKEDNEDVLFFIS